MRSRSGTSSRSWPLGRSKSRAKTSRGSGGPGRCGRPHRGRVVPAPLLHVSGPAPRRSRRARSPALDRALVFDRHDRGCHRRCVRWKHLADRRCPPAVSFNVRDGRSIAKWLVNHCWSTRSAEVDASDRLAVFARLRSNAVAERGNRGVCGLRSPRGGSLMGLNRRPWCKHSSRQW